MFTGILSGTLVVSNIEEAIRIRTQEKGEEAV
jgi:nitrogen regulatory protein PII